MHTQPRNGTEFSRAPLPRPRRARPACALSHSLLAFVFCLFTSALAPVSSFSDATVSTGTREGRLAVFDDVWQTVGARYYDARMRGLDWAAERERFRPLAAEARTTAQFYTTLRRMLAELHDAHTRVYSPEERFEWDRPTFTGVGLSLREVEGRLVVARVEKESEARRAGVRAGQALSQVDGEPVAALLARRADEGATASTPAAARLSAIARLFDGERDTAVALTLADGGGRERVVRLRRSTQTITPRLEVRRVEGVAVVRFNFFTQEIATSLVRALRDDERLSRAGGIVIDLRENGGGEAESMIDAASAFLPAGTPLGAFTDRDGRTVATPQTRSSMLFAADAIRSYGGALVVLTGARTASAAEIFAAALKDAGRARVVGETTCGCVLAIRARHPLPDGGLLDVSEMDYRTARGARLEGAGVAPDEIVTPTRDDITRGRDPALLRAVDFLKSAC
ncbi:MAG TPA: S41 family peptidase [Pyrinomonadaceae bacterium]|nr:S41 family peptidase [Pyrinomonadaceae bacterium]